MQPIAARFPASALGAGLATVIEIDPSTRPGVVEGAQGVGASPKAAFLLHCGKPGSYQYRVGSMSIRHYPISLHAIVRPADPFGNGVTRLWIQPDDPLPNARGCGLLADILYRHFVDGDSHRPPSARRAPRRSP